MSIKDIPPEIGIPIGWVLFFVLAYFMLSNR